MTSTNINQGLNEGAKPSSKVLRPPGGGSSDIFGTGLGTAPVASPHRGRAPPSNNIFGGYEETSSDKPKHNRLQSSVFEAEPTGRKNAKAYENQASGADAANANADNNKSDEEKDKENGEEEEEKQNNNDKPVKSKDVSNPITGETKSFAIGGAGETVGRPSTRVHHPPGGASTPLW